MHPLSHAERVYVETTSRRRPEANDELDLRTRNRDAGLSRSHSYTNSAATADAADALGAMRLW